VVSKLSREYEVRVKNLARVEGEGGVYVKFKGDKVDYVEVSIYEPPRFFEALLRGRDYRDAVDITSRICGICPLAYVMSSSRAIEKILGIEVDENLIRLRRAAYLGEWVASHVLHITFLHAPDFLGYKSAIQMVEGYGDFVKNSLRLKSFGNKVVEVIAGRPVHPVGFRVGGMHRVLRKDELKPLLKGVKEAKELARDVLEFVLKLPMPEVRHEMTFMSLRNGLRYPVLEGDVVASNGLSFPEEDLERHIIVEQMRYSNSLRYRLEDGSPYVVGPSARFNLNYDLLHPEVKEFLKSYGVLPPLRNSYQSIIARAAETYHAIYEIEELLGGYKEPERPYLESDVSEGESAAITEAPRGMLYHRYRIGSDGKIIYANIIAPTCQNYAAMEEDIKKVAPEIVNAEFGRAQEVVEQIIRNYDPCISCSVHAIRLSIIRE